MPWSMPSRIDPSAHLVDPGEVALGLALDPIGQRLDEV